MGALFHRAISEYVLCVNLMYIKYIIKVFSFCLSVDPCRREVLLSIKTAPTLKTYNLELFSIIKMPDIFNIIIRNTLNILWRMFK